MKLAVGWSRAAVQKAVRKNWAPAPGVARPDGSPRPTTGAAPRTLARRARPPARARTAHSATFIMVQDEAALRLRTLEMGTNEATRSRTAKVQMTCCSLRVGAGEPMEIYTELEGLADKTADTLATCLEKVTRATATLVGDAVPPATVGAGRPAARYIFTHILVGDGIQTKRGPRGF